MTDRLRLWYGRSGPVVGLSQVGVPGCQLLVAGCCTTPEPELHAVAGRLARGETAALGALDGSHVVIAVRSDDVLVAGDLAGQCPVFFTHVDGTVAVGSHAGKLAEFVGRSLDREWLATRLLLASVSDLWWTGTPWQAVHTVRPGWLLHINSAGRATTRRWLDLGAPAAELTGGGQALRAALQQAVAGRVAAADQPTLDLSGGLDSSTLAVLATAVTDKPIQALTLTVDGVEDAAAAVHVANMVPGLMHEQVEIPESVLPYSDLDPLPAVDEPGDYLVAGAWVQWWRRRIAEYGRTCTLAATAATVFCSRFHHTWRISPAPVPLTPCGDTRAVGHICGTSRRTPSSTPPLPCGERPTASHWRALLTT